MLKRARRAAPHTRNRKAKKRTRPAELLERSRAQRSAHELHAPRVRKNGRRDAEADDIGQRIELAAEFARRIRQTRDAAVEPVRPCRESDRSRRNVEIRRRQAGVRGEGHRAVNRFDDREKAQKNIACRKQCRQRIGSARRPLPLNRRLCVWLIHVRQKRLLDAGGERQRQFHVASAARQHAGARANTRSRGNLHPPFRTEDDVHARAEFDQPHPLARLHRIAHFLRANDPARDQPRNLLDHHHCSVVRPNRDNVLLILGRRDPPAGNQKLAALIGDVGNDACNRRPVHVHVEDIEEDADPRLPVGFGHHAHHPAISRRQGHWTHRKRTLGIAKKPRAESSHQKERHGRPGAPQPEGQRSGRGECQGRNRFRREPFCCCYFIVPDGTYTRR